LNAGDTEQETGKISNSDTNDGYDVLIKRLRSPPSADLVQVMRHFASSLEICDTEEVRDRSANAAFIQLPAWLVAK